MSIEELSENLNQFAMIDDKQKGSARMRTGLVYDERMSSYRCKLPFDEYSEAKPHPECPERITRIYEKLLDGNLVSRCVNLESRFATKEEIIVKHSEQHYSFIMSLFEKERDELEMIAINLNSIYLHKNITQSALLSAGCTLELVRNILNGNLQNGAAIVRPPGHHATKEQSMGFCHLNNVALAAVMAMEKYQLSRILILDWDVHYGNGTHQMFDDDPRVLYFSLHRYNYSRYWPSLPEANYDYIGNGPGIGFNSHVAWNKSKIKTSAYLYAFDNLLIPMLRSFDPELILVSAGFDAGINDPLGKCQVTPYGYAQMTKRLMQFAGGKVAVILEGGYNLDTISTSMASCVSTLLGDEVKPDPVLDLDNTKASDSALRSISNTFFAHLPYWQDALGPLEEQYNSLKCLLDEREPIEEVIDSSEEEDNGEIQPKHPTL